MTSQQLKPHLVAATGASADASLAFQGHAVGSVSRRRWRVEALLPGFCRIDKISVGSASSDMTVDRAVIQLQLRAADGGYHLAKRWERVTINRTAFSNDADAAAPRPLKEGWVLVRNNLSAQMVEPTEQWPNEVTAIQFELDGHGWFSLGDVQIIGEVIRPFSAKELEDLKEDYEADSRVFSMK